MRLFSYKMTNDTGFAPNPYGHTLTLSTCKPQIRRAKLEGDWVAGFTSVALNRDRVGEERLIYLMRIGEKVLQAKYHGDPRFQDKIPNQDCDLLESKFGDNIYRPLVLGAVEAAHFVQLPNLNHWDFANDAPCQQHAQNDLSGRFVLVADEFYYFGADAIVLPGSVRPALMRGQSGHGRQSNEEQAKRLIAYIRSHYQPGRLGDPTQQLHDRTPSTSPCGVC